MNVTIEVINQRALNLLRGMEDLGLIHMQTSVSESSASGLPQNGQSNRWLRGCCKDLPHGSVDEFLARCHADKDQGEK